MKTTRYGGALASTTKQICGAKLRAGGACKKWAMHGRNRCRLHGGMTPTGAALPQYKHGKYSKYLPAGLNDRYEKALSNPQLISLRHELALADGRLTEIAEKLKDDAPAKWRRFKVAAEQVIQALNSKKSSALAVEALQAALEEAPSDAVWDEWIKVSEHRRRLSETEGRLLSQSSNMWTAEQAMSFVASITHLLVKHIPDKVLLSTIGQEIRLITHSKEIPVEMMR